jgi:hypothetical protein
VAGQFAGPDNFFGDVELAIVVLAHPNQQLKRPGRR